ncbi:MAG: VPS10 domain-containing protein [Gammaproteobacteria bacterium]
MKSTCLLPESIIFLALFVLASSPIFAKAPEAKATTPDVFHNLKFRNLGPAVSGGRVTATVGIPGNPKIYYVGAAGGGVWKTVDGGLHWKAIFTKADTSSIGAIALAPSNSNLVWVGTGEVNIRNDVLDGGGLYLSPDAGKTWKLMGFKDAGQIAKIVVDPQDANTVWVAVLGHAWGPNPERGVFKTSDGGKTWKKVLFVNDHTGAIDLTMDGSNPQVLFAAMWQAQRYPWTLDDGGPDSGIWRSTDGGDTWTRLTTDLPKPPIGRISIAVASSNPERLYALIETKRGNGLLFDSSDMGDHWQQVSEDYNLDVRPFYFSHVYVSPNDENKLYFASFFLMESNDGGHTARPIDLGVHVDHHAFWQDPMNPDRIIQGNDGGAYLSQDGGKSWRFLDGMPIAQFYMLAADSKTPYDLCGGLQDNNGWCGPSSSLSDDVVSGNDWFSVVGGDGEYVVPAPSDPNIIYANAEDGAITRFDLRTHLSPNIMPYLHGPGAINDLETRDQKYRFNWTSPIAVSPMDANTVYMGGNVLFKSTDGGTHWTVISPDLTRNDKSKQLNSGGPVNHDLSGAETYDTILSITLAPTDPKIVWVGTDDGLVQMSRNNGKSWSNVTPSGAPKWSRVYQVGVSPFNAGTAYVAFDNHEMDDHKAYVYKTDDYGKSWHNISKGLPDQPVLVVREDPNMKGFLMLGNMTGLWYSRDAGGHWQQLKADFPTAAVFDLKFVHHALAVATHGRGLFVLDNLRPIEEMNDEVAKQAFHLFTPSAGIQFVRWSRGEGAEPSFTTPNAHDGPILDYYLKTELKATPAEKAQHHSPVKIVITDSQGQTVATDYGSAKAGVNQFVWNMSYDAATQLDFEQLPPYAAEGGYSPTGPTVLPGTYKVAVTANGQTQTTSVTVNSDQNQNISLDVMHAALKFGLAIRNETSAFNQMLNRIVMMQKTLGGFEHSATANSNQSEQYAAVLSQAKTLNKKLTDLKNSVYNPDLQHMVPEDNIHWLSRLNGQLQSLDYMSYLVGQAPTEPMLATSNEISAKLNTVLAQFNSILATDVPAYNKTAYGAGAPTLLVGQPISIKPVQM